MRLNAIFFKDFLPSFRLIGCEEELLLHIIFQDDLNRGIAKIAYSIKNNQMVWKL